MAVGVVAELKVKPGMGAQFEELFQELNSFVQTEEPGTLFYQICKKDSETYVVLELYKDRAAVDSHSSSKFTFQCTVPIYS